jgi:hypothetical protein
MPWSLDGKTVRRRPYIDTGGVRRSETAGHTTGAATDAHLCERSVGRSSATVFLTVFIQSPDRFRFRFPGLSKMNDEIRGLLLHFVGSLPVRRLQRIFSALPQQR